jgi:hypothetical protein
MLATHPMWDPIAEDVERGQRAARSHFEDRTTPRSFIRTTAAETAVKGCAVEVQILIRRASIGV